MSGFTFDKPAGAVAPRSTKASREKRLGELIGVGTGPKPAGLPKSLHTVRILALIARSIRVEHASDLEAVLVAADLCGYPDASESDPLIVKAAAQLAGGAS